MENEYIEHLNNERKNINNGGICYVKNGKNDRNGFI